MKFTRRNLLQGFGAAAGAGLVARATPGGLLSTASAAPGAEPSTVVLVFLNGGYNALFCCAKDVQGTSFETGVKQASADVFVDASTLGKLDDRALGMMATIGVNHGESSHPAAKGALWTSDTSNYAIKLAAAMEGEGAFRAVTIGGSVATNLPDNPVGGVSMQSIRDLDTMERMFGAAGGEVLTPEGVSAAMNGAKVGSKDRFDQNPEMLTPLGRGYDAVLGNVLKPPAGIKQGALAPILAKYGVNTGVPNNTGLAVNFAGAEYMINAGANVITLVDGGWDTHGDADGTEAKNRFRDRIMPGLNTFVNSVILGQPNRNVTLALFGDFSRSLPRSDHQPNLSMTVIGKNVKPGSTGSVNSKMFLKQGGRGVPEMWAYLAALAGAKNAPFGPEKHGLVKGV